MYTKRPPLCGDVERYVVLAKELRIMLHALAHITMIEVFVQTDVGADIVIPKPLICHSRKRMDKRVWRWSNVHE